MFQPHRSKVTFISQTPFLLDDELNEKLNDPIFQTWLNKLKLEKQTEIKEINGFLSQQNEFSGGEIQKLAIIEALLKQADLLIIDEGTSNIDFAAENTALEELFGEYENKIIIFIAHRLTTVSQFHRILVLDNGSIIEEGSHKELIDFKGKYWSMWGEKRNF
jgi:ABC-type multidrug transport system fused ATPase/permease subunit